MKRCKLLISTLNCIVSVQINNTATHRMQVPSERNESDERDDEEDRSKAGPSEAVTEQVTYERSIKYETLTRD